jgi:aminopeptidase N
VGGPTFFQILRDWAATHRYGNATTQQFIHLAVQHGGAGVASFLHAWLFRPIGHGKPPLP